MIAVRVSASRTYDITIGSGLLPGCGQTIRDYCPGGVCAVVTDDTVNALYAQTAEKSLRDAGLAPVKFVFPHGESAKNAENYIKLLEFLAENGLTRADAVVALGGGVAGDLAGFAAATYLRGISLIQLPTTLLAAVDSSVGGKTGIDLRAGKNLAGAFYQPCAVLCDVDTLATLPEREFRAGCGEVAKYAVLCGEFYDMLLARGTDFPREPTITRCVLQKRDLIAADEFDVGQRQLLNLGHTVGHAVEALSGYTIRHGEAVAIGMATIARAAAAAGLCGCADEIGALLNRFGLPTRCPYDADALVNAMRSDKKRRGDTLTLVIPEELGHCVLHPIRVDALYDFVKAGIL